jgi:hypothetical protein
MICAPCKDAGKKRGFMRQRAMPMDQGRRDYLKALHSECESPDCPCQHRITEK